MNSVNAQQISTGNSVKVGVIVDNNFLTNIQDFFQKATTNIITKTNQTLYTITPQIDSQKRGCGIGDKQGDGAYLATEYYYVNKVTALFGPVCNDDLSIVSGLTATWNLIQFNFWRDYFMDIQVASIIQMSTQSASNIAANLVSIFALFNIKSVAIIRCSECYSDIGAIDTTLDSMKRVFALRSITILADIEVNLANATDITLLSQIISKFEYQARVLLPFLGNNLDDYTKYMQAFNLSGLQRSEYVNIVTLSQYSPNPIAKPWETTTDLLGNFENTIVVSFFVQVYDGKCTSLSAVIADPSIDYATKIPPDVPNCGFRGELCDQKGTIVIVVAVLAAVVVAVTIFFCARKMRSGETASMPWAVPSNAVKFVDQDYKGSSDFQSMSMHSLDGGATKSKVFQDQHSRRMFGIIDQQISIIEVYQLREKLVFDKKDMALLFMMKQAVHDNTNAFIGVAMDMSSEFFVIWKHCIRGTLADIIFRQEDDRNFLNQDFTGAFVRDIIKGLDFLHSSTISYHGALTTSNCLIDSHWILKLSGFGINRLLYKWRLSGMIAGKDGGPIIPDSELHYYAPNLRSKLSRAVARNKMGELELAPGEGPASDMYSFGIILYEILYKKKAFTFSTDPVQMRQMHDDNYEGGDEVDLGIASEAALSMLPTYPSVPDNDNVHPDLVGLMHKCFHGIWQNRPDANMVRKITDATLKMPGSLVDQMIKNMESYNNNLEQLVKQRTGQLEEAQKRSEEILTELLPKSVADELKLGRTVPPKNYKIATVMYSDIVGFTSLCSESQPMEVVDLLSGVFKTFDGIIGEHQAYKVETIGDAYMVASGVPEKIEKKHVREIAMIALKQREFLFDYIIPHRPGQHLHCRWGFNTGPVFTGVVGITAPRYCVFGGTVTVAAKMENSGQPDRIQMTVYSQKILSDCFPEFKYVKREQTVRVNGLGNYLTYWLEGYEELLTSYRERQEKLQENNE